MLCCDQVNSYKCAFVGFRILLLFIFYVLFSLSLSSPLWFIAIVNSITRDYSHGYWDQQPTQNATVMQIKRNKCFFSLLLKLQCMREHSNCITFDVDTICSSSSVKQRVWFECVDFSHNNHIFQYDNIHIFMHKKRIYIRMCVPYSRTINATLQYIQIFPHCTIISSSFHRKNKRLNSWNLNKTNP